tara:strand:- start:1159 stop:2247 length:1089 start_codon:yes stop_codon:yes gene_type:complete
MAFTKLVSNIIKQKVASNLIQGFSNAAFGQPKKLAAKLASKSPLDLSQSPVAHMEPVHNPFNYGSVYYPNETSNLGEGHYIIFDVIEHQAATTKLPGGVIYPPATGYVGETKLNKERRLSKLKAQGFQTKDEKLLRTTTNRMSQEKFFKNISESIILYTPSTGTKFDYSVSYEGVDTNLAKQLKGLFEGGDILGKLGDGAERFFQTVITAGLDIALPGFSAVTDKTRGKVVNPNAEMVFTGVPMRTFNFPFEFAPKNVEEKNNVQKIINLFKFHMMPEKEGEGYLTVPSEFQITYMYKDGANMYIPKISRCVLKDMSVDYSPEGVFTTFKGDIAGAHPVLTKMDLTFNETEIMTKETIAAGH